MSNQKTSDLRLPLITRLPFHCNQKRTDADCDHNEANVDRQSNCEAEKRLDVLMPAIFDGRELC